ncbi:MAG: glycosyl hydrolase family 28-related protein [Minicystis sp.]
MRLALALPLAVIVLAACSSGPSPAGTTSASSSGSGGLGGASSASSASSSTGTGGASAWRSALYPEDWSPSFTDPAGNFIHDFSYAGYHNGEAQPGAPANATIIDAATFGADPTGATDATAAVQQALDAAAAQGGAVVRIPAGLYRFDGTLLVKASNIVLRGAGADQTRLYFTKSQGMSDGAHLRFAGDATVDIELPLTMDGVPRETTVAVADLADLAPGDDIAVGWVITPEFIEEHGMTGTWTAFNGTWQPFFRRTVVAVDSSASPPRVTVDVPIRYPARTRDQASIRRLKGTLRECGVESLAVSNAVSWDEAWTVTRSHVIEMFRVADGWVRDVATFPSPIAPASGPGAGAHLQSGGILINESKRVTVSGVHLGLAQNRGDGGNGYLFEVQRSSEILFRDAVADGGRHNFIQNWGFGTTGCVWSHVHSLNGLAMITKDDSVSPTGLSEFHHSLATANLIEASTFDDGFSIVNRQDESTGAGHTGTQNVLWNLDGKGMVRSLQFQTGYLIGTQGLYPVTDSPLPMAQGTAPIDWIEGLDQGQNLQPASLYDDQLARRLKH